MITTINEFKLILENNNIKSPNEIIEYITEITPNEDDVPDFFLQMIKDKHVQFELKRVNIQEVINNDIDVMEYIKSNDEDRYANADEDYGDYVPKYDEIDNPIVILDNIVLDGYNRLLVKSNNGETEIDAYVSI